MMERTVGELAELVGGRVVGDPSVKIKGVASLREASPGEITFVASDKYLEDLKETRASAAIVSRELPISIPLIVVPNPLLAMAKIMALFWQPPPPHPGISDGAWVSPSARIGKDVSIGPFVYVGDEAVIGDKVALYPGVYVGPRVKIGPESILYPNVVLYEGTVVGKRVVIHAGSVIGADGFGYVKEGQRIVKIPQMGIVEIGDEVEIGANCCIDRATFGRTFIGRGVKMDNLIQIGHNVSIGENTIIVAQVGVSGSCEVGRNVTIAGQVGVADHVKIGDGVQISAKAGISRDIPPGEIVGGIPQMPHRRWLRVASLIFRLPDLKRQLDELVRRVEELSRKSKEDRG
ncbi:MAG TPA: UDP-3-O-(3-hydroxymyristoyl)glucosamine N-acyltransferase [Deltaproteobacteria bacterium]|nr:UDP-3-O-(3-hydroxymyristoyl)glucosamine N-acyltransferase [Deltaproteobacteria bacterium]